MDLSVILLLFVFLLIGFLLGKLITERKISASRKDAVLRSRNVISGKMLEQIAPYLPNFPYNPADIRFLGSPIDFVVFEGMCEKEIKRVIFVEVKSNKSSLNGQEKKLKEAIQEKKVSWEEFRL
jgi:predicted Holliday junction resolvase-like endonuclease